MVSVSRVDCLVGLCVDLGLFWIQFDLISRFFVNDDCIVVALIVIDVLLLTRFIASMM